jgi:hypothetical protein
MQIQSDPAIPSGEDDPNQAYGLLVRQPHGNFLVYAPGCKDEEAEVARTSGAKIQNSECHFPTRTSLEKALLLLRRRPGSALKLVRIRS